METFTDRKEVVIQGRKFVIKKFDARTGSFMLIKVTGILAPMFKGLDLKKIKADAEDDKTQDLGNFDIAGVVSGLSGLSEQDFNFIQGKCLNVCYEELPAGLAKVFNPDGTFGVVGLETDTMTIMALTAHALIFNVTGFFGGSPLGSVLGGLLSTNQSTVKM